MYLSDIFFLIFDIFLLILHISLPAIHLSEKHFVFPSTKKPAAPLPESRGTTGSL